MGGSLPAHIHLLSKAFAHLSPKKWGFISLSAKVKKMGWRLPSESPCGLLGSQEYNWEEQQKLPTAEALCRVLRDVKDFNRWGKALQKKGAVGKSQGGGEVGGTGALSIICLGGTAAHESQCPEVPMRECVTIAISTRDSCVLCIRLQVYSSN